MADAQPAPEINITIKAPSDTKHTVTISPSSSVLELKQKIETESGIEVDRQRLIYSGKVLKDEEPISTYKIQNNHTIHLVRGAAKPGAAAASGGSSAASSVPSNFAAGLPAANDPLAQLEGVRGHGMGGGAINPFAQMPGMEGGMGGLRGDPNAIANMMNNPEMISHAMNSMTPEMMDQIIASNPQFAGMGPQIRQMMNSPMMRQMMSDPQMIRQMMAMSGGLGGGSTSNPFPAPGGATPTTTPGGSDAAPPSASGPAAGASPFAGMFGGAGAPSGGNPFGMDPAMMAQMREMMGGGGGFGGGGSPFGGMGGGAGGFGAPAAAAAPSLPQDTRPIEERFQSQLLQLNEMGLVNPQQNLRALSMTGGNVQAAIELIFSGSI